MAQRDCDVRLVITEGTDCDVALEVDILEEDTEHTAPLIDWVDLLLRHNRAAYKEPPPPTAPCLAEPGTEASIQAMELRANRVCCCNWRCDWSGLIEQTIRVFVTLRPRRNGCPWCGGPLKRCRQGLRHPDDCRLNFADQAARQVTRGRNGGAIPGILKDVKQ